MAVSIEWMTQYWIVYRVQQVEMDLLDLPVIVVNLVLLETVVIQVSKDTGLAPILSL